VSTRHDWHSIDGTKQCAKCGMRLHWPGAARGCQSRTRAREQREQLRRGAYRLTPDEVRDEIAAALAMDGEGAYVIAPREPGTREE